LGSRDSDYDPAGAPRGPRSYTPHELQDLVHLVLGCGDAHEGTPAGHDFGIRLGFVRRDPKRDQRGRLGTPRAHVDVHPPRGRDEHLADGGLRTIRADRDVLAPGALRTNVWITRCASENPSNRPMAVVAVVVLLWVEQNFVPHSAHRPPVPPV
jgi:hypothetical protein